MTKISARPKSPYAFRGKENIISQISRSQRLSSADIIRRHELQGEFQEYNQFVQKVVKDNYGKNDSIRKPGNARTTRNDGYSPLEEIPEDPFCVILECLDCRDLLKARLCCRYLKESIGTFCARLFTETFNVPPPEWVKPKQLMLLSEKVRSSTHFHKKELFLWACANGFSNFVKRCLQVSDIVGGTSSSTSSSSCSSATLSSSSSTHCSLAAFNSSSSSSFPSTSPAVWTENDVDLQISDSFYYYHWFRLAIEKKERLKQTWENGIPDGEQDDEETQDARELLARDNGGNASLNREKISDYELLGVIVNWQNLHERYRNLLQIPRNADGKVLLPASFAQRYKFARQALMDMLWERFGAGNQFGTAMSSSLDIDSGSLLNRREKKMARQVEFELQTLRYNSNHNQSSPALRHIHAVDPSLNFESIIPPVCFLLFRGNGTLLQRDKIPFDEVADSISRSYYANFESGGAEIRYHNREHFLPADPNDTREVLLLEPVGNAAGNAPNNLAGHTRGPNVAGTGPNLVGNFNGNPHISNTGQPDCREMQQRILHSLGANTYAENLEWYRRGLENLNLFTRSEDASNVQFEEQFTGRVESSWGKGPGWSSCIYVAAKYNQVEILKLLLRAAALYFEELLGGEWMSRSMGDGVVKRTDNSDGKLEVPAFFRLRHSKGVEYLVNYASTRKEKGPLVVAAENLNPEICNLLLVCKADPLASKKPQPCALEAAIRPEQNVQSEWSTAAHQDGAISSASKTTRDKPRKFSTKKRQTLWVFCQHLPPGVKVSSLARKILMNCITQGDLESVKILVEESVGLEIPDEHLNEQRNAALQQVFQHAEVGPEVVDRMREIGDLNGQQNQRNEDFVRQQQAIGRIMNLGDDGTDLNNANQNQKNKKDAPKTPLQAAIVGGHFQIAEYLLVHATWYTNREIDVPMSSGKTSLYLACAEGKAKLSKLILTKTSASLDVQTCSGKSPLHAAVEFCYEDVVRVLCEEKVDVRHITMRTKGEQGVSPFMLAEKRGKTALILPMLRAYHYQVRKRFLLRQCGDAVDDVSHPYLTCKLLEYKGMLFKGVKKSEITFEEVEDSFTQKKSDIELPDYSLASQRHQSRTGKAPHVLPNYAGARYTDKPYAMGSSVDDRSLRRSNTGIGSADQNGGETDGSNQTVNVNQDRSLDNPEVGNSLSSKAAASSSKAKMGSSLRATRSGSARLKAASSSYGYSGISVRSEKSTTTKTSSSTWNHVKGGSFSKPTSKRRNSTTATGPRRKPIIQGEPVKMDYNDINLEMPWQGASSHVAEDHQRHFYDAESLSHAYSEPSSQTDSIQSGSQMYDDRQLPCQTQYPDCESAERKKVEFQEPISNASVSGEVHSIRSAHAAAVKNHGSTPVQPTFQPSMDDMYDSDDSD